MRRKLFAGGIPCLVVCLLAVFLVSCSNPSVTSLVVSPASETLGIGNTAQFTAMATLSQGTHPKSTEDVTDTATWSSSNTGVATVSSTGMVTAVASGTTNITAKMAGFPGTISASVTLTVSAGASLTSLSIIPGNQTVLSLNETSQYIAIGEGQGGIVTDVTNSVTWASSDVKVATINSSGLATGINPGSTTITAIAKNPDGSVLTATATFTESHQPGSGTQLPSLTVYKVGNNAATGTVTAVGTNDPGVTVINCGAGAGCVANFPVGTTVTLTAIPGPDSTFGGWSSECTPNNQPTCTVTVPPSVGGVVDDNATVGAIFN